MRIDFFSEDLLDAASAGIYEVDVCKNGKTRALYIGESVFAIVRGAWHIYRMKNDPRYFGFADKAAMNDPDITLRFFLVEHEENKGKRKKREKEWIQERRPLSQSGISDRQKSIEDKILALSEFLETCKVDDKSVSC